MIKKMLMRWVRTGLVLSAVFLLLRGEVTLPMDLNSRLNRFTADKAFDFTSWEADALMRKLVYRLASPHRYMDDESQAQFVLDYLDKVREAQNLGSDIDRIYTDPEVNDPDAASQDIQVDLAQLRVELTSEGPIAEAILEDQVSTVLRSGGFGPVLSILPPVQGIFTPLPYILIVSPREKIESIYQQQLVAGLTAAQQDEIEKQVVGEFPDYSAYTTGIGGLAAYPAMLLESSSIDWVADVMAHEWVHHYLSFYRLGWNYMKSGESRTINETTASLVGDWAGQEIINRYYAQFLDREKALPNALTIDEEVPGSTPDFDFRAEMQRTRLNSDRLLAEGKVNEAEWYMEFQRRYFVANGYRLRRLNQAYFAFHGAYADTRGAAGSDPVGPAVRRWWMLSQTPKDFVAQLAPLTSLSELETLLANRTS